MKKNIINDYLYSKKDSLLLGLLYHLLVLIYPNYIIVSLSNETLKTCNKDLLTVIGLYDFFQTYKLFALILLLCSAIIIPYLIVIVKRKIVKRFIEIDNLKYKNYVNLLADINTIVGDKKNRFYKAYKDISSHGIEAGEIFKKITQPQLQIESIGTNIYIHFKNLHKEAENLRISIMECKNESITKYIFFYPRQFTPHTSIIDLNTNKSTAGYALRNRRIIVIEDTKNNKDYFQNPREVEQRKKSSILSFPVVDEDNLVIFIITLCAKNKVFIEKNLDYYNKILLIFSERLLIEYYLFNLKESIK